MKAGPTFYYMTQSRKFKKWSQSPFFQYCHNFERSLHEAVNKHRLTCSVIFFFQYHTWFLLKNKSHFELNHFFWLTFNLTGEKLTLAVPLWVATGIVFSASFLISYMRPLSKIICMFGVWYH